MRVFFLTKRALCYSLAVAKALWGNKWNHCLKRRENRKPQINNLWHFSQPTASRNIQVQWLPVIRTTHACDYCSDEQITANPKVKSTFSLSTCKPWGENPQFFLNFILWLTLLTVKYAKYDSKKLIYCSVMRIVQPLHKWSRTMLPYLKCIPFDLPVSSSLSFHVSSRSPSSQMGIEWIMCRWTRRRLRHCKTPKWNGQTSVSQKHNWKIRKESGPLDFKKTYTSKEHIYSMSRTKTCKKKKALFKIVLK